MSRHGTQNSYLSLCTPVIKEKDYSILVVDDEPANVRLLTYMLRDLYRVREAYSGSEALQIANSDGRPALILLDVIMPDIDGFEVCRRLKDQDATKDITIIFVTTLSEDSAEEIGLNLGAVDYIIKPLRMSVVRARVRNHMNLCRQADMLAELSFIDGLTHVHNRRRFDAILLTEWQRGRRLGESLAVIMIDFDHFKALNDYYGHGTGDACLQQGAKALADTLKRPTDLLARYGGEEFVAILPETDLAGACVIAEAMRQAINALNLKHAYSTAASHVTISLGVSAMIPSTRYEAADLLALADQALNQAKREGRNRVQVMPLTDGRTVDPTGRTTWNPVSRTPDAATTDSLRAPSCETMPSHAQTVTDEPLGANALRHMRLLLERMLADLNCLLETPLSADQSNHALALLARTRQLQRLLDDRLPSVE